MEVVSAGQEMGSAVADEMSDIVKCAEEAQVQASADLLCNLRLMVNKPAFSDVVFLCRDGNRVHASRILLAGRSEVLKSMFMNVMAESGLSEIKMPGFSSPVLLAVFEFLYTGILLDYQPRGWAVACEVILASRFFLLPHLQMITRKFMHTLTSAVGKDLPKAATMLTEAVAMRAFLEEETDVNLKELVTILSSDWSDSVYIRNLSEDALDYLLENSGGTCEDDGKLSFEEYRRFRQVIRWWIWQSDFGSRATEELLTVVAPDEEEALFLCRNPDDYENDCPEADAARHARDMDYWRENKEAKKSAMRLMSNIDFRWIHPAILATVVEPLKVVTSKEILGSFRFHALRRPMIFKSDYYWDHGDSYCTLEPGYVLQKIKDRIGLAVMKAATSRSYGVHQWRFVVEQPCDGFVEMGFMPFASGEPEFDGERLSVQDDARVLKVQGGEVSVSMEGTGGGIDWTVFRGANVDLKVCIFNYNAVQHTCSLTIDGKDFGTCWERLPSEVYYPAVCLGASSKGRVRFEVVRGFDTV
ncbi:unnamed protein product [Calypogeia fissa]